MTDLVPGIRNTARALIIRNNKILLLRKDGGVRGERYALPGGAQDPGETLEVALNRECEEEIGSAVEIGNLVHIAEFFKLRDSRPPTRRHLVEFLFECTVSDEYEPHNGYRPDKHQVEVVWADLKQIDQMPLFPSYLKSCIADLNQGVNPNYLGVFHDHADS